MLLLVERKVESAQDLVLYHLFMEISSFPQSYRDGSLVISGA